MNSPFRSPRLVSLALSAGSYPKYARPIMLQHSTSTVVIVMECRAAGLVN